jgi:hypothetical protein
MLFVKPMAVKGWITVDKATNAYIADKHLQVLTLPYKFPNVFEEHLELLWRFPSYILWSTYV